MKKLVFFFIFLIHNIAAKQDVIYELDEEDYYRMPSKYSFDRFGRCLAAKDGQYCTVWADLVSDQPSELLDMVQAYSAHDTKHFNHSNIKYGLCITSTCKQFYDGDSSQEGLWNTSEACLNDTLNREHGLKARVTDIDCYHHKHEYEITLGDRLILAVLYGILALNIIGTIYDVYLRDQTKPGNKYLVSFSILGNWRRMMAPSSPDPVQVRMRSMNGAKALTSMLVVLGHVPMPTINAAVNPKQFEDTYRILLHHILHQGHLVTLTFFTMSGFLLAYNLEIMAEKHKLSIKYLPQAIIARWFRLSPANFVVLLLTAVWYKFIRIGPLFKEFIVWEATDCRKYWLHNVFYTTNLINHSQCNLQVWFLGSDMQLHILALIAVLLAPNKRARTWALIGLYLFGIGWPAYQVYLQDLNATYLASPTTINQFCNPNREFNYLFKPTIPNLPCFIIGMFFGYFVYSLQKRGLLERSYREYRVAYWCCIPFIFLVSMSGVVVYLDGPQLPLWLRLIYAPIVKPLFGLVINLVLLGAICRCDDLIRGMLEWDGWAPIMRISYCMYLIHMVVLRYTAGVRDAMFFLSPNHLTQEYFGMLGMTIIYAALLHLLVEAPFAGLFRIFFEMPKPTKKKLNAKSGEEPKDAKNEEVKEPVKSGEEIRAEVTSAGEFQEEATREDGVKEGFKTD